MQEWPCEQLDGRVSKWGEGPIWDGQKLWYVDIEGHAVIGRDLDTGAEQVIDVGERVGTVVARANGGLLIAGDSGIRFLDPASGEMTPIADPEPELRGHTRFNDGKCDPAGRFWGGTISMRKQPEAALYRLDPDLTLTKMLDGITNSNGICWNAGATVMYYIDTPTRKVVAYDFELSTGAINNPRTVVDTAELGIEGSPDGMVIDAEGMLWVAIVHAGFVYRFDPASGQPIGKITVPTIECTAMAFCGPDLDYLIITTGLPKGEATNDADGHLFGGRPGVKGVASFAFAS